MYKTYKDIMISSSPQKDLNKSISNRLQVGKHQVTIKEIRLAESFADFVFTTDLNDEHRERIWIWDSKDKSKLSWNMWRLIQAIVGDKDSTYRLAHKIVSIKDLVKLKQTELIIFIAASSGYKIAMSSEDMYWLLDGQTGKKLSDTVFASHREAAVYAINNSIPKSWPHIVKWETADECTNRNKQLVGIVEASEVSAKSDSDRQYKEKSNNGAVDEFLASVRKAYGN